MCREGADGVQGDGGCILLGVAIDASGDARKGNGLALLLLCALQAIRIAVGQQLWLAVLAVAIDRAWRVDDVFAGQLSRTRQVGLARLAAVLGQPLHQLQAFVEQLPARCTMNGAINATAAQETTVCCIDNGIHLKKRDIACDDFNIHVFPPFILIV